MQILNAEEQRAAEENAESNMTTLRFLCENFVVCAIQSFWCAAHGPN